MEISLVDAKVHSLLSFFPTSFLQEKEVQLPAPDSDPLVGDVIDEEDGPDPTLDLPNRIVLFGMR